MNQLKHILVAVALLATMLPCSHAIVHHEHDHGSALELCAVSSIPCECHSCDHEPSSVQAEILFETVSCPQSIEHPSRLMLLFIVPDPLLVRSIDRPRDVNVLTAIQTIQLLI